MSTMSRCSDQLSYDHRIYGNFFQCTYVMSVTLEKKFWIPCLVLEAIYIHASMPLCHKIPVHFIDSSIIDNV